MGAFGFDEGPPGGLVGPIVPHTHVHKDGRTDETKYHATAYFVVSNEHDLPGVHWRSVQSWIGNTLRNPDGWSRTGIEFVDVTERLYDPDLPKPYTFFQYQTDPPCEGFEWGCTQTNPEFSLIALRSTIYRQDRGTIAHEAAHAYFRANHAPEGGGSIMEPYHDTAEEGSCTTADIQTVKDWLASAGAAAFVDTVTGTQASSLESLKGAALRERRKRQRKKLEMREKNRRRFEEERRQMAGLPLEERVALHTDRKQRRRSDEERNGRKRRR